MSEKQIFENLYEANLKQIENSDNSDYHPHHNSVCEWCNNTDMSVAFVKNKGNICSRCKWELN